jgi:hypothetical protein
MYLLSLCTLLGKIYVLYAGYGFSSGSFYIFARSGSTWTQQQKLIASDSVAYGYTGGGNTLAVSEAGNIAVAGSSAGPNFYTPLL